MESTASDDGAVHLLWRYITHRRLLRVPQFDLDDPAQLAAAAQAALDDVDEFSP